jgi:hypothetical protein
MNGLFVPPGSDVHIADRHAYTLHVVNPRVSKADLLVGSFPARHPKMMGVTHPVHFNPPE